MEATAAADLYPVVIGHCVDKRSDQTLNSLQIFLTNLTEEELTIVFIECSWNVFGNESVLYVGHNQIGLSYSTISNQHAFYVRSF